jgi:ferrochelatase
MTGDRGPVDAVLLIGYGGPEGPDEIMPFLRKVVEGRGIPDERLREVEKHYLAVGGRSPYNELAEKQRAAVQAWLESRSSRLPVYLGMRLWGPLLEDVVRTMKTDGHRHAVAVVMAPHRCEASWDRYLRAAEAATEAAGGGPALTYLDPWYDEAGFLAAHAERLKECRKVPDDPWPEDLPVVFTAHSIPKAMAEQSSYVDEIHATCRGVAELLEIPDWELAYQSRSGPPQVPWLEPDVNDVLRRLSAGDTAEVVVQAIGFLCDHVEVLYDLDVEARETATQHGLKMRRAGCVNDHPEFIAMVGERVLELAS